MPDLKISQLPYANALSGTEAVPVVQSQGGVPTTVQTTVNAFLGSLGLSSGHFTPTFSGQVNISAISANVDAMWLRIANIVIVQYSLFVTPTTANTTVVCNVSLPNPINPSTSVAGQGTYYSAGASVPVGIQAVDANDVAFSYYPPNNSQRLVQFSITYRLA